MKDRSSANAVLVTTVCIMWFGFIMSDLFRLHDGVLHGNGYFYYDTARAVCDLLGAAGALMLAVVAAVAARRGPSAGERGRAVTAGALAVLAVQIIIMVMVPVSFLAGASFR